MTGRRRFDPVHQGWRFGGIGARPHLKVPYKILFPMILLFCVIGAYSVSNQMFDIYLMLGFGVLG